MCLKAKAHCCSFIVLSVNMIMSLYAFGYIFWLNIISAKVQMSTKMSLSIASLGQRILTGVFIESVNGVAGHFSDRTFWQILSDTNGTLTPTPVGE